MKTGFRLRLMLDLARCRSSLGQLGTLADQRVELIVRWQVRNRCQFSELPHRVRFGRIAAKFVAAPEVEGGMSLESGHAEQDLAIDGESRAAPLHRFLGFRRGGVHPL